MAGESSSRLSSTPLRRRMHILERASRSFTTADSSTRNGDADDGDDDVQPLPSPPTSHDYHYDDDEEDEEEQGSGGEEAAPLYRDDAYEPPPARPWYKPSYTVILALAPPIGNWLTGGDHLKDLLLLLLIVFYLHQLIEVPWNLYHAARPRRLPASAVPSAPPLTAIRAQSELRTLELSLLFFCFLTPLLGVALLRSLASLTTGSQTPISWFSTSIFALLTALRPLRELVARISSRASILHAHVHAHTAPPPPAVPDTVAALTAQVSALEAAVVRLAQREEALYAYVEDAVAPLEKGMRRVERRVGKLRAAATTNKPPSEAAGASTVFVPAQPRSIFAAWMKPTLPVPVPPRLPPPAAKTQHRRGISLDSIPEEAEYAAASTSTSTPTPIPAPTTAHPPSYFFHYILYYPTYLIPPGPISFPALAGRTLLLLALLPLWVLLWPVRKVVRYLER